MSGATAGLAGLMGTTLTAPGVGMVFLQPPAPGATSFIAEGLQQDLNLSGANYTFAFVDATNNVDDLVSSDPSSKNIGGVVIGQTASALLIESGTPGNPIYYTVELTQYNNEVYPQTFNSGNLFMPCFLRGTMILTLAGEIAVEDLEVGALIPVVRRGGVSPVKWIGRSSLDCRLMIDPAQGWPVRVRAGALAENAPHRDLWLSPQHALLVGDVLIPVRHLVNGHSIAQLKRDQVEYFHVELQRHDVLMAEGAACESYLDTDNRGAFQGGTRAFDSSDEAIMAAWAKHGCAELVMDGPLLEAAWARLDARGSSQDDAVELPLTG